jgi:SsrA-binding protein
MASQEDGDRTIATNRRARHDYEILETIEAGLVLRGTEVKSLRGSHVTFKDAFATVRNNEAWLIGCHINPYSHGTDANHDPERDRKLLLHRREIARLTGKVAERGLTLIPLRLYFKGGRVKLEIGLARGKKLHDKRSALRERETRREMEKAVRASRRGQW